MDKLPSSTPGRAGHVPAAIKILGFASFALSVTLAFLVHHYLTTFQCPIPPP
ncbi:MAG TPA: hypothetical protein VFM44_05200 [Gemmatimonadota bacterium]|nr:hypothetical protein [Gemmatimonadota bacterium]